MWITKIDGNAAYLIMAKLQQRLLESRFSAEAEYKATRVGRRWGVKIQKVRLRQRKHFCGNHPNACAGLGGKHMRATFLEGADWVQFNDLINDLLDATEIAADVFSRPIELTSRLMIRKGRLRRTEYQSEPIGRVGQYIWAHDQEGVYEDYIGKCAPRSIFPDGTPGINTDQAYVCVGHEEHQH